MGQAHGDIQPRNISISNRQVKLYDPCLYNEKSGGIERMKANREYHCAASPQALYAVSTTLDAHYDEVKNDIWGMGITLLSLLCLEEYRIYYNWDQLQVKMDEINHRFNFDWLGHLYSKELLEIIALMLTPDETSRPNVNHLERRISYIRQGMDFNSSILQEEVQIKANGRQSTRVVNPIDSIKAKESMGKKSQVYIRESTRPSYGAVESRYHRISSPTSGYHRNHEVNTESRYYADIPLFDDDCEQEKSIYLPPRDKSIKSIEYPKQKTKYPPRDKSIDHQRDRWNDPSEEKTLNARRGRTIEGGRSAYVSREGGRSVYASREGGRSTYAPREGGRSVYAPRDRVIEGVRSTYVPHQRPTDYPYSSPLQHRFPGSPSLLPVIPLTKVLQTPALPSQGGYTSLSKDCSPERDFRGKSPKLSPPPLSRLPIDICPKKEFFAKSSIFATGRHTEPGEDTPHYIGRGSDQRAPERSSTKVEPPAPRRGVRSEYFERKNEANIRAGFEDWRW